MDRIANALNLRPLEINLCNENVELSPPVQTETGVSYKARYSVAITTTTKAAAVGFVGVGVLGGAGGVGFAAATDKKFKEHCICGIKLGSGLGLFLGGVLGAADSYFRVVEVSRVVNDYVHPTPQNPEYAAAKSKGTEILKTYFAEVYPDEDPNNLFCPITYELMKFPVKAEDNRVYEYEAIANHLLRNPNGVNSSPFRTRQITMNGLHHHETTAKRIGKRIERVSKRLVKFSGLVQEDLDSQFKEMFNGQNLNVGAIQAVDPQTVVDKLTGVDNTQLTPTEIKCLNVVVQPFIKLIKDRNIAIYNECIQLFEEHWTAGRITMAKRVELTTALVEWAKENKIA